jgi:hypothetical protein
LTGIPEQSFVKQMKSSSHKQTKKEKQKQLSSLHSDNDIIQEAKKNFHELIGKRRSCETKEDWNDSLNQNKVGKVGKSDNDDRKLISFDGEWKFYNEEEMEVLLIQKIISPYKQ